jgi:hypothetical protein
MVFVFAVNVQIDCEKENKTGPNIGQRERLRKEIE